MQGKHELENKFQTWSKWYPECQGSSLIQVGNLRKPNI